MSELVTSPLIHSFVRCKPSPCSEISNIFAFLHTKHPNFPAFKSSQELQSFHSSTCFIVQPAAKSLVLAALTDITSAPAVTCASSPDWHHLSPCCFFGTLGQRKSHSLGLIILTGWEVRLFFSGPLHQQFHVSVAVPPFWMCPSARYTLCSFCLLAIFQYYNYSILHLRLLSVWHAQWLKYLPQPQDQLDPLGKKYD